jgi:predicted RNA-binding Zn ribbon-like protein
MLWLKRPLPPVLKAPGVLAHSASPAGLLALLAREAIYVLGSGNVVQLRQCASPTCTIFFVDTSRAGDRRWCSMAACGNKARWQSTGSENVRKVALAGKKQLSGLAAKL